MREISCIGFLHARSINMESAGRNSFTSLSKVESQCAIYHEKQACFTRKKSYTKLHENPTRGLVVGST